MRQERYHIAKSKVGAVLLCAGLVLAGCGVQEEGQSEEQMEEQSEEQEEGQAEGQAEEQMEGQSGEQEGKLVEELGTSILEISPKLSEYRNMTYGEFQKKSGREAEFLHGTFYFALLEELDVSVVFSGEYDEEAAGAVLTDGAECIRLEGRLGKLLAGFDEEMEAEEFAAAFVSEGESAPVYYEEEGAGTAYYVADRYIVMELDSDKDGKEDLALEISLDDSEKITPESYAWVRWKI